MANKVWNKLDILRNYMNDTQILNEMMQAMSAAEAMENIEFIARNWNINLDNEEDED